jgi:hypothetical protein
MLPLARPAARSEIRVSKQFVSFPENLFASAPPAASWEVVCDNLNAHMSEGVTSLVSDLCGINEDLGEKGKLGILLSKANARRFNDRTIARTYRWTMKVKPLLA